MLLIIQARVIIKHWLILIVYNFQYYKYVDDSQNHTILNLKQNVLIV